MTFLMIPITFLSLFALSFLDRSKKWHPFIFVVFRTDHLYKYVLGVAKDPFFRLRDTSCVCVCVCVCVFVCLYNMFRNLAMLSYQKTEPQGRPPRSSPENDTRDVLNVRKQVSGNNPRHALNARKTFPRNIKTNMSPKKVTNACEHVKTCIQKRADA